MTFTPRYTSDGSLLPRRRNEWLNHLQGIPFHIWHVAQHHEIHFLEFFFESFSDTDPHVWRLWVDGADTVGPVECPEDWPPRKGVMPVLDPPPPVDFERFIAAGPPPRSTGSLLTCVEETVRETHAIPEESQLGHCTLFGPYSMGDMRRRGW